MESIEFCFTTVANALKVFQSGVYTYAVVFFGGLILFLLALLRGRFLRALGGLATSCIAFVSVWFTATYFPSFTPLDISNCTSGLIALALILAAKTSVDFWKTYCGE